jgi:hypothetical protein
MSITQIPLDLISPGAVSGVLSAAGNSVHVTPSSNDVNELRGFYDPSQGILTLSIPNIGKINIAGFPTKSDVGVGRQGPSGRDGSAGIDGLIGEAGTKGSLGCRGPEGPQGRQGERGPRGLVGPQGQQGIQGIQGNDGRDGKVLIFIQSEQPGAVGAGAIWIRP